MKKKSFPTYEEAKIIIQEKGIQSSNEYKESCQDLGLPVAPNLYYKGKGWVDMYDYLGKKRYPTFEEAKRIVQKNGIRSRTMYKQCYKDLGLPAAPYAYYEGKGWTNEYDFYGKKSPLDFPSYEEAKKIVQEMGIMSRKEYKAAHKSLGLPSHPDGTYKDSGWTNWFDFCSKPKKVSPDERKRKILEELFLVPTLLKDDELLQIIYIMAPHLDKKWVEEIQSLLGTTSYEERLKWVKEQLKGLKEGGVTKSKKHGDEDTGRKRILEEVEVVMGSEKVKGLLENYYHSIVNRELIKETDGE